MITQIIFGSTVIAITSVIHTLGLTGLIFVLKRWYANGVPENIYLGTMRILLFTIIGLVLLHTAEIWIWAALFVWLEEFETLERALYFSTVTFTTLGYGDIVLNVRWQFLSGFEALNGVILLGISTAFAFAIFRQIFVVLISPSIDSYTPQNDR